jgi:trimethylamine:corrinoid methyltransferase-like protein
MHSNTPDILASPSTNQHQVLSQSQLDTLKVGTLHVLEDIGVRFPSQKALEIFADHGADVDWDTQIVRIAPDLVEKALSTAPRSFVLGGREPRFDLTMDGKKKFLSINRWLRHSSDRPGDSPRAPFTQGRCCSYGPYQ